ncbi:MAG: hypothetical protein [Circular genetic element sp.]|nr:MAG: hypothetical protein [Circular genetic element sp.]
MVDVRMTMDEYLTLLGGIPMDSAPDMSSDNQVMPKKKKMSAYTRRYKANFKKIENNYKLKNGNWKKNGFKRAVTEAHRMSKK